MVVESFYFVTPYIFRNNVRETFISLPPGHQIRVRPQTHLVLSLAYPDFQTTKPYLKNSSANQLYLVAVRPTIKH